MAIEKKDNINRVKGDTSDTITSTTTADNIDFTGCSVRIKFRKEGKYGKVVRTATSAVSGGITVSTATSGTLVFDIDKFIITWDAGTYYFEPEVTLSNGDVYTLYYANIILEQDGTD